MLRTMKIRLQQFVEEAREKSPREALMKSFTTYLHFDRVVVPVYNDLFAMKPQKKESGTAGLEFVVIDRSNAEALAPMNQTASRRLKLLHNTSSGYYAYAVLSQGEMVGDIWCATPENVRQDPIHPDLVWLGIQCRENEAYMFDMFVTPGSRGKVITGFLLGNALEHLKKSGFSRAYGFYDAKNLPALWTHRLFGYTELEKRKLTRVLFYINSQPIA